MYVPAGVIPAVLLPFHDDLSIDEASYRAHLRDVAAVEGLSAITVNAHASEVASCSFDEQRRVLEISKDELGALPIVNGVYADGSLEAARIAKMAERAAPRRYWCFHRRSTPSASARKWRSSTSVASRMRPACR